MRDLASWPPLASGASSRNLGPTSQRPKFRGIGGYPAVCRSDLLGELCYTFQLLLCLCSCCWKKDGQYSNIEGGQNEKVRMVVTPAASTADSRYNTVPARVVRPPTVTADLYQNVGSSPPPYTQALR